MATYHIYFAEFEGNQAGLIDALLTIGDRFLADAWRSENLAKADVILLFYGSKDGSMLWHRYQRENPGTPIILCGENLPKAQWRLEKRIGALPSLHELTEILNHVGQELGARRRIEINGSPTRADTKPIVEIKDSRIADRIVKETGTKEPRTSGPDNCEAHHLAQSNQFIPDDYFLGLLQHAQQDGINRRFIWGEQSALYFIPEQNHYYSPLALDDLTALFCLPVEQITITQLDIGNAQEKVKADRLTAMPIVDLIWCATLAASQGRLLVNCNESDIVNLSYWPDVSHLPRYREFLPLAAFMNSNAADLSTIAQTTGRNMAVVYDFHNTCEALGLLDRSHNQPSIRKREVSSGLRKICQRISNKLNTT